MKNKDYTKYSDNSKKNTETVDEIVIKGVNEIPENAEIVEGMTIDAPEKVGEEIVQALKDGLDNVEPESDETNIEPESDETIVSGVVYKCNKLNVRKEPSKDSEIVCVIKKDTELTVDITKSTEEFYKVYTSSNNVLIEGYCMKEFVQTYEDIIPN